MSEIVVGIDIGGTNTKVGLVTREGTCLASLSMDTHAGKPIQDFFLPQLAKAIEKLLQKAKADNKKADIELKGVGMGAPNANYYTGTIEQAPNLNWGSFIPICTLVKDYVNVPVWVTNDANAAAIGEMKFGVARGMKNFVVITLGTGLGSGIVANGELLYGHDGFAGEIGHVNVNPNGRWCGCGKRGCLETYVSATGIKRTIFKLLADHNGKSELSTLSFDALNATMITEAARRGDRVAMEAFEYTGRILGMKLADTVAHLSPEAIVLFGGLANAGEFIVRPTQQHLEANLLSIYRNKVKIVLSDLKGDNTAILGSAALAWTELDRK